ncbi:cyclopropane mycolic acid synthase family methyltransferase [Mycolicibacterium celeriflavum]|uniref:Cyclopropane-fatty-acyl-phospholipid synthase n=1 Tax=Mycolicibacterium celeriflavum TaxID=1249101 RepID=A0A1X0BU80_MYCCF|nr:cyclopropane mycolic acid synthase family methyltransferase [Mycolicibacterium celeriflavum]ORA47234.1 SAM-dependent methyltransferase [Mycolicibacterium celeriflavum]BBY44244.1 cyclopropane-fatty-acyl-phospholipid synthase [Mycolicibacterium celeriflavum]
MTGTSGTKHSSAPEAQSKWLSKSASEARGSDKNEVQFHYDISNDFFKLWQDPTQTYSCAYFERDDYTLEQAQRAKVDLSLGKLGLQPGMTLLDIGCGWGSTIARAVEKYDVNVIGLTLSENQKQHIEDFWFPQLKSDRKMEVRLQPWEEFEGKVDRIVSIGAFEHFGFGKYDDYFKKTFSWLPDDGVMMLHTIIIPEDEEIKAKGLPLTMSRVRFIKFIMDEIYPGGRLPLASMVREHANKAGYTVTREQHLQPHYVKTLDTWAANLEAKKDEAIAITSEQIYERFRKYLTGCADLFREGYTDVAQFTCEKAAA